MRLFIGNATKQVHRFYYRLPEVATTRYRDIQIGQQICLDDREMSRPALDDIIAHQAKYGFVAADELDRVRDRHIGLIYSIDKPIPPAKMVRMVEHNDNVLIERGKTNRRRAGIAAGAKASELVSSDRPTDSVPQFEITVQEEQRDTRDTSPHIREGHKVAREDAEAPVMRRRGRRQAR